MKPKMKILSIDTSSKICGVSILDDRKLICNLDKVTEKSHSENLMPMVEEAFNKANCYLRDIDLIVCDVGPGSFTGIRIGVATAKGFVDSLGTNCVGISSLEALAYSIHLEHKNSKNLETENSNSNLICSILDCKNNNCYFALYQSENGELTTLIEPEAECLKDALSIVRTYCEDNFENASITFVGDGSESFRKEIEAFFASFPIIIASAKQNVLNSYCLALAGLDKYNSGLQDEEILPLYLKKTLAQRQLEETEFKNSNN